GIWNVLPAWLGEPTSSPLKEATVCVGKNSWVLSIRQGSWKLLVNADHKYVAGQSLPDAKDTRGTLAQPELFNLATDPYEQHNLAATQPDKFKELSALLEKYRAQGFSRRGW